MGSKVKTTLADEGTREGAPTNCFGTPSGPLFSRFGRLCQAPDKMVLFYRLRPAARLEGWGGPSPQGRSSACSSLTIQVTPDRPATGFSAGVAGREAPRN